MTKAKEALDEFKNASDSWCYAELFLNHSETIREALELLDKVQRCKETGDGYVHDKFVILLRDPVIERKDYDRE
jgi:hypothetical protein